MSLEATSVVKKLQEELGPSARLTRFLNLRDHSAKLATRVLIAQVIFTAMCVLSTFDIPFRMSQIVSLTVSGSFQSSFYLVISQALFVVQLNQNVHVIIAEKEMANILLHEGELTASKNLHRYFPSDGNLFALYRDLSERTNQGRLARVLRNFSATVVAFASLIVTTAPVTFGALLVYRGNNAGNFDGMTLLAISITTIISIAAFLYFGLTHSIDRSMSFKERLAIMLVETKKRRTAGD